MWKIFALVLLCAAASAKQPKPKKACSQYNIVRQKCSFGKTGRGCLPRVHVNPIKWEEVTPYKFTANWKPVRAAKCYTVELLSGFSSLVIRTLSCYRRTSIVIKGLKPWHQYGIQVSVVNFRCLRGRPGRVQRTKTFWAPTAATTTTAPPTFTPRAKQCGRGFFTCASNKKQCIPNKKWCDRKLHCDDGSDERACPGGCKELKINLKHGNHSCTRWGSPDSFCFFDCQAPYVRDGHSYTQCLKKMKKWSNPIPKCRLSSTESLRVIGDETTGTTLTVEWKPVDGAVRYAFQVTEQVSGDDDQDHTTIQSFDSAECCSAVLTDLTPNADYTISMRAIDAEERPGIESPAVHSRTLKDIILKSSGSR